MTRRRGAPDGVGPDDAVRRATRLDHPGAEGIRFGKDPGSIKPARSRISSCSTPIRLGHFEREYDSLPDKSGHRYEGAALAEAWP
ncbi:MAG: hypothetical protein M3081_02125, partial [Gemmatimonadota bacterium]|nr:hypothetical protein [Gemmatimonadota bacterium]